MLGKSSCINTSYDPSNGVFAWSCTIFRIFCNSKHASTTLNLTITPKGSLASSPLYWAKGKDEWGKVKTTLVFQRVMQRQAVYSMHNKDTNLYYGHKNYTTHTKKGIIRFSIECTRIREWISSNTTSLLKLKWILCNPLKRIKCVINFFFFFDKNLSLNFSLDSWSNS